MSGFNTKDIRLSSVSPKVAARAKVSSFLGKLRYMKFLKKAYGPKEKV